MKEMASLFSLQNMVELVTGASQGIGKEIALTFSHAGARLVICSRNKKRIEDVGKEIRESGKEVLSIEANVSSAEDRERLVRSAVDWGGKVDILVNNAGANPVFGPLADISESAWDKVFEVNLFT
jgi:NAD(P)-dependent dehydrogenase (short-subunit alcohol dehydrogenase family)